MMLHKYVLIICVCLLSPILGYSNGDNDTFIVKGNVVNCTKDNENIITSKYPVYVMVLCEDSIIAHQTIASDGLFLIKILRHNIKGRTLDVFASQIGPERRFLESKNYDFCDSKVEVITDLEARGTTLKLCMGKILRCPAAPIVYYKNASLDYYSDSMTNADSNMMRMVDLCKKYPSVVLQVTIKPTANEKYSQSLNRKRANKIKTYLLSKGVKSNNIQLKYNATKPEDCTASDKCLTYFTFVVMKI